MGRTCEEATQESIARTSCIGDLLAHTHRHRQCKQDTNQDELMKELVPREGARAVVGLGLKETGRQELVPKGLLPKEPMKELLLKEPVPTERTKELVPSSLEHGLKETGMQELMSKELAPKELVPR